MLPLPTILRHGNSILDIMLYPGGGVGPELRAILLRRIFVSPRTSLLASILALIISSTGAWLGENIVFKVLLMLNILVGLGRHVVLRRVWRTGGPGATAATRTALHLMLLWCSLQGAFSFFAAQSDVRTIQTLGAILALSITGPICARTYPAPRLAMLMIGLCIMPFAAGICLAGDRTSLIVIPLMCAYIAVTDRIVRDLRDMAVKLLSSELESERRARLDPLTGLWNRLGYDESLANSSDVLLTLFCLDLDGFKQVNDTFGHPGGDRLLQGVARRLEASVRTGDTIYRTGGDEFVIMARGIRPDQAALFATRVIDLVTSEPYGLDGGQLARIGVSIGYACLPDDGTDPQLLHRRADEALYDSKAAGKRVSRRYTAAPQCA